MSNGEWLSLGDRRPLFRASFGSGLSRFHQRHGPLLVSRMFSRSKRRLYRHPKPQRGVKDRKQSPKRKRGVKRPGNRERKKGGRATQNTKRRSCNRECEITGRPCTMHQPLSASLGAASRRGASSQLGAAPLLPVPAFPAAPKPTPRKHPHPPASQQRTPRLPRNTPNPRATARLVAHFSRKTAERKVTHITKEIVKPLILILLMETPEAPKRGKSPKPCHIRTYSVTIPPKS